ncbi:ABC transporter permease [Bariatricus massiliensis]|uniref:ABC transporter permease n=1 Tax=Bariatricus massiliensis TaxID=1745713 RepID=A0ABS8DI00_9FIRM|nr:ABC transporter permease [Bariatricus massiliensis]MCB7304770.1 ABC transporter permease [Bariatricus massiliensis]MCB7375324.1 ABC transporter permease [Bariatricus massiliensis]MCB7387784.1 ABC transporter permease [Bariatricus massiliensis]MCB7412127.1 ABC transporter permease [Bariatricus massiliensis]MCQ5254492.1 ABC transporter permease [Bariatricus massiliensis]
MKKLSIKKIWKTITGDRQLLAGTIGLALLLLLAVAAAAVATENPYHYGKDMLVGLGENGHILGTNHMGQDIYSMIIYGIRTSLKVAVISALISGALGVFIGGIGGFFGGKVDTFISELINVFMMLPSFFLILLIIAMFGNSITNVMIVIGITTWPSNAKLMRAQALSLRERTFVKSAVAMGETKRQILFKYIIPNGIFPVIANTTMGMSNAILTEAGLSFLGLGDPGIISWGQMIYTGKQYITSAWWISAFAGAAIVVTVLVFYLLGDGLNHVLDPKYSRKRG